MLVVGLTGGIGSGKTTVAKLFAEKGITIIDTDQLARQVTLPDTAALSKIIEHFGYEILLSDNTLNRALLRNKVFNNEKERMWLEQLLHPLIRKETQKAIEKCSSPYCIVVIPLLLETLPNPLINRILVIDAAPELQLNRAKNRDQSSADDIQAIINAQINREKRLQGAHDIIYNDGLIEDLIPQVEQLHRLYLSFVNIDTS